MDATIRVFTFKEGLLSKLAHDLMLSLTRFNLSARGSAIEGRFDPGSLRVDGAMRSGKLDVTTLSESDKDKIKENIAREVLHIREHPEIRFQGSTQSREPPFVIAGTLTLCGQSRPLELALQKRQGRLVGDVEIVPSHWGIKPYRALGGTLKVQDRVLITVDASAAWLDADTAFSPAIELTWAPR